MRTTIPLQYIERLWLIFVLAAYAVASYFIMPNMDNTAELGSDNTAYYYVGAFAVSVPYLFLVLKQLLRTGQSRTVWSFVVFFLWATVATILSLKGNSHLLFISFPVLPLLISYTYFRRYEADSFFYTVFFISLLLVSFQYFHIYQIANQINTAHIGVSYFALMVLPLVLLHPSRIIRILSWIVVSAVIVSSIKRGGFVTLLSGAVVYVWCKQYISNKRNLSLLFGLIGLGILAYGINHMVVFFESDIFERFMSLQDDQGSGRLEVWQTVIDNLRQSDTASFLLGHGYRSVEVPIGNDLVPAHNDFLEVFYDFGLIGLVLYLIAWYHLIADTIRMIRRKSPYAPTFSMMVVIVFIFSMLSIVIYYFWVTYFFIMIGLTLGQHELEQTTEEPSIQYS